MKPLEIEGEVLAKSYPHAKRVAKEELSRDYPNHLVVILSVEMKDGLRLHSSPLACFTYSALLKIKERTI